MKKRPQNPRRLEFELLETRHLLAAEPIISEIMASNAVTLSDGDGNSADWIELHNRGDASINLNGWYLTDDQDVLTKWQFPDVNLDTGGYLVVFASGQSSDTYVDAGGNLHTNFKLDVNGEYLALVEPDGVSIADALDPMFPPQHEDISYGLEINATVSEKLVSAGASSKFVIPSGPLAGWTEPTFNDSGWTNGQTGVGFENLDNLTLPAGLVTFLGFDDQNPSTTAFETVSGSSQPITGSVDFVSGQIDGALDFDGTTTIDFGQPPDGLRDGFTMALWMQPDEGNRTLISGHRSNLSGGFWFGYNQGGPWLGIAAGAGAAAGSTGSWKNVSAPGTMSTLGQWYHVAVTFDPTNTGEEVKFFVNGVQLTSGVTNADLPDGLMGDAANDLFRIGLHNAGIFPFDGRMDDVAVFDRPLGGTEIALLKDNGAVGGGPVYTAVIETNVEAEMFNTNSSAYMRIPFNVTDPAQFNALTLRMKYDDGFVAYLNGVKVASQNAPAVPTWNSAAAAERQTTDALVFQELDISQHLVLLNAAGTNVLAIQGLNVSVNDGDFLALPELIAASTTEALRYFPSPTPGAANSAGVTGIVADTQFNVDRGFYDAPFELEITTSTPDAVIRYTVDGSAPTADKGTIYTGPITIDGTTTIRAVASKEGYLPTNVDTQSYIFLADVIRQPANPEGLPSNWGSYYIGPTGSLVPADYEMNQSIVESHADTIIDDLRSLPTLSIVMDHDDLFDVQNGIYPNPFFPDNVRERATSLEWIDADGSVWQEDAAIRIFGGWSKHFHATPKKSFALKFKRPYGPTKLDFPLFAKNQVDSKIEGVTEFDTVLLRAVFSDAWPDAASPPQYLRDLNARYAQLAMGQPSSRGTWVHLYLNGLYWGIYNPSERPDASFAAAYGGGDKEEYDAVKHTGLCGPGCATNNSFEVIDGGEAARQGFQAALNLAASGLADANNYATFKQMIDVENLADYILLQHYIGNVDWPHKNWYANRERAGGEGWQFFVWDSEYTLRNVSDSRLSANNPNTPAFLWNAARQNAEFRAMFADRVHKHLFNDGVLQPAANIARYEALANVIDGAIKAEAARWGDNGATRMGPTNYTYANWDSIRNGILTGYFPQRHAIALNQLRSAGLYPRTDAPEFNKFGGTVDTGFQLTMTAPIGVIFYTLDGSDPRGDNAGEPPTGTEYTGPLTLDDNVHVKARVLNGTEWSALTEATFVTAEPSPLRITEIMYNPAGSDDTEFIELRNTGDSSIDLGGVRFAAGVDFTFDDIELDPGENVLIVRDRTAFNAKYTTADAIIAGEFVDSVLDNGGERLQLVDAFDRTILDFEYRDDWYSITDGLGFSLVTVDAQAEPAAWQDRGNWRPSGALNGSPGTQDAMTLPAPGAIVVNELLSYTDDAAGDWIELYNNTNQAIDIGNWFISDDAAVPNKMPIPANTSIPAGGHLVLTERGHFGAAVNLSEVGGEVSLTAGLPTGDLAGYQFTQEFGAADKEVTLGRYLTSDARVDFVAMSAQTPGGENGQPAVGPVVISEIMYHPATGDDEFIEIYNISDTTVPLFDPAHPENTWQLEGGVDYLFPAGTEIAPRQYMLVVATDPEQFRVRHHVPEPINVFGPYAGNLNNGGESVRLERPGTPSADGVIPEILADRVRYRNEAPWPTAADGLGPSLERITASSYGNDPNNWMRSAFGGSPGVANVGIDTTPPSMPTDLHAIFASGSHVELSWTAAMDAQSSISAYQIFRGGTWIGTTDDNFLSFTDVSPVFGPAVSYQVSAVNGDGLEGTASRPVVLTMLRDGTVDTQLAENTPTANFAAEMTLLVSNDDPEGSDKDSIALLRWDLSAVPEGAILQSASISLEVTSSTGQRYELYEMRRNWVAGEANWHQAADGQPWQAPGASGSADRASGADSLLGTIGPSGTGKGTLVLTAAGVQLLQSWLEGSTSNYGFALVPRDDSPSPGGGIALENLIAFYPFDEIVDGRAPDQSINGNDGTIQGIVITEPGFDGGSFRFNGNAHVVAPININPSVLPKLTMGAWVKTDPVLPGLYKILGHDNGGWDRTIGLDNREGAFRWTSFVGYRRPVTPTAEPVPAQWSFVAAVYDETIDTVAVYIDLDAASTDDALLAFSEPTNFNAGQTTTAIGNLRPDNFAEGFFGQMDNVFFFNDALTGDQMDQLRSSGAGFFSEGGLAFASSESAVPDLRPSLSIAYQHLLPAGDVTGDGVVDDADIDALFTALDAGSAAGVFDIDGSGSVDRNDVVFLVENRLGTRFGDANLDAKVDGVDFSIWRENRFATPRGWAAADFTGDFVTDGSDVNLWNEHKFTLLAAPAFPLDAGERMPRAPQRIDGVAKVRADDLSPTPIPSYEGLPTILADFVTADRQTDGARDMIFGQLDEGMSWQRATMLRRPRLSYGPASHDDTRTMSDGARVAALFSDEALRRWLWNV